jgi:hypothetical protein
MDVADHADCKLLLAKVVDIDHLLAIVSTSERSKKRTDSIPQDLPTISGVETMTAVLDQVKDAAYAAVGVNLLVTDAIVGRELPTPEFAEEHTAIARKQATETLTDFRARFEPRAVEFEGRFPEQVAERLATNRTKAWDFIGIDAPKAAKKPAAKKPAAKKASTKKPAAKKA